ncbi:MAG: signal peptidase I, partial [Acidimicrobiales bacterium]
PWAPAPRRAGGTLTLDPEAARPVPADDAPPGGATARSTARNAAEWVLIIGAALVAALVIKTYLVQAFYIPSPSMEPTLMIQDRVLVNKLSYRLHDVNRGDVVVFERPPNESGTIRDLIKRVIGLSGDTVEGRDGDVYVNGRELNEPYLPAGTVTSQFGPEKVPHGYVWVMGDNRANSSDSRVFGAVDEDRIVGRAFVRVWPISALGLL